MVEKLRNLVEKEGKGECKRNLVEKEKFGRWFENVSISIISSLPCTYTQTKHKIRLVMRKRDA